MLGDGIGADGVTPPLLTDGRVETTQAGLVAPSPAPGRTALVSVALALGRRVRWFAHRLRWTRRFRAFGRRSVLIRPDQITGSRSISIGAGVDIRRGARLEVVSSGSGQMTIGDNVSIHFYFHCGAAVKVEIGDNVLIAGHVFITDHDHDLGRPGLPPRVSRTLSAEPTIVEADCWLGEGCKVLKGVRLGRGCVVAAGAIVTRSFPPYTVIAGVPGRPIKRWDEQQKAWLSVQQGQNG